MSCKFCADLIYQRWQYLSTVALLVLCVGGYCLAVKMNDQPHTIPFWLYSDRTFALQQLANEAVNHFIEVIEFIATITFSRLQWLERLQRLHNQTPGSTVVTIATNDSKSSRRGTK